MGCCTIAPARVVYAAGVLSTSMMSNIQIVSHAICRIVVPAGEMYASALGDIYTFGPTFRAENSNTSRHLAEFWMIEPELAFADLADDMACAEAYLKHCVKYIMEVRAPALWR